MMLLKRLRENGMSVPTVVISETIEIAAAVGAIRDGATDFLTRPLEDNDLLRSIEDAKPCRAHFRDSGRSSNIHNFPGRERMTLRELEVLKDLANGATAKASGVHLGISYRTVEDHRRNIKRKLSAHSVADIMRVVLSNADRMCLKPNASALSTTG
jgi:FixJ family two-component response regulator